MPDIPLLSINRLDAFYGDFQALHGIDLDVRAGEVIAIIGANGAGKSTLLNAIVGLVQSSAQLLALEGTDIRHAPPYRRVARGIALVPEGRRLFVSLSLEENLRMGARLKRAGPWTLDAVYALFPMLAERRHVPVTMLSGGQQQMVAIGRALMSNPNLLLCDEISLGLAPVVIKEIYAALSSVVRNGLSAIVVEQDIQQALKIADHVHCMREGRFVLQGAASSLSRQAISAAYFGV